MANKDNINVKSHVESKIRILKATEQNKNNIEKKHKQEIKLLNDRNKIFLVIIGHDIKIPMSSIVGFLSTLKEKLYELDKRKIEEYIDISLFSAKKSFILLDSLIEWAFAENSIKSFNQESVNLNVLIKEVIENVQIFASNKLISIETINIPTESVFIDKNMIKTVLRNLLNNAIKYTNKDGEIVISALKYNGFAEISIKDNGVGINKENLDLIFNTSNNNTTPGTYNEPGSGFGLLLCKEFIDIHKGKIRIISKPGEGSEFKFTIPFSNK